LSAANANPTSTCLLDGSGLKIMRLILSPGIHSICGQAALRLLVRVNVEGQLMLLKDCSDLPWMGGCVLAQMPGEFAHLRASRETELLDIEFRAWPLVLSREFRIATPRFDAAMEQLLRFLAVQSQVGLLAKALEPSITELLLHLLQASSAPSPAHQDRQYIRELEAFVDERLGFDLSVEDLSRKVKMSNTQLLRVLKRDLDQTPASFIIFRRLSEVRRLLRDTNIALVDIALRCGFSSQPHMSNAFKKEFEHTPGRFRELSRGQGGSATSVE
jgi:AraC-like DNA-binding protein